MKTFAHLIFTCFVSFFAFCGALSMKDNPWPGFAVAFGIWGIFLWRYNVRTKREAQRRQMEEFIFREYMRSRTHGNRNF
ncbi:hypothetical protein SNE26_24185 [Mucilaginibacter sp. cycad4]|uniref:hypothetical protein n=1 Tax=Mucilaginibacter sp. cycad4 TaxID=3342096 RepID=UPI002AAB19B7|nr:hypothetical protein [Mucilaginibacter gossypii]WPU99116.1 hypothetical protein SNE26_24185 [Mucilaginibacter gossypii]